MKISFEIFVLVMIIYSVGQVQTANKDEIDVWSGKIAVTDDRIWNPRIIPYKISTDLTSENIAVIENLLQVWSPVDCSEFVEYDENQHLSYLSFVKSNKCSSHLGKYKEGENIVSISKNCSPERIEHVIAHALGYKFSGDPGYEKLENILTLFESFCEYNQINNKNSHEAKSMKNNDENVSEIESKKENDNPNKTNSKKNRDKSDNDIESSRNDHTNAKDDINFLSGKIAVTGDRVWNQRIVPFKIYTGLTSKNIKDIESAMEYWSQTECFKFVEYDENQHSSYLLFIGANKCISHLGKYREEENIILISDNCSFNRFLHYVIGYALGYKFSGDSGYEKLENVETIKDSGYYCPEANITKLMKDNDEKINNKNSHETKPMKNNDENVSEIESRKKDYKNPNKTNSKENRDESANDIESRRNDDTKANGMNSKKDSVENAHKMELLENTEKSPIKTNSMEDNDKITNKMKPMKDNTGKTDGQNADKMKSLENNEKSSDETNLMVNNNKNVNEIKPMKDNAEKTDEKKVNKMKPFKNNGKSPIKTNLMEDNIYKNVNKTKSLKNHDKNANQMKPIKDNTGKTDENNVHKMKPLENNGKSFIKTNSIENNNHKNVNETKSLKNHDKSANQTKPIKDNVGKTDEKNVNKMKLLENNGNSSNKTNLMEDNNKNVNETKSLKDTNKNANQTKSVKNDDKNTNKTNSMTNSYGQVPTKETYFYEFDVFLIDTRVAINNSRRWDEGIIPVVFEDGFSWDINRAIAVAMRFWESRTCIKFVARDETLHSNYLTFIKSDRCESQLGRHQKGANIVFISDDCHPISIGREIGHAIGFVFSGESGYLNFIDDPHWGLHFECPRNNKLKPIPECGDTFIGPTGLIVVPDQLYESFFTKCEWRIYGSRSDKIVLEIEGLDVYESSKCLADYLEVRDGYWSESPLLGHFCGKEKVPLLKSQSNRMLISYIKRSISLQSGFKARFYKTCGGHIEVNNNTVYLESPNYPLPLETDSQCIWNISYPQDKTLEIITYDFWLEESSGCENNFLEIHNSKSLIGRYCGGRMPNKTMLTGGKARVDFVGKNWTDDYSGFSILVRAVETETPVPGSASYQSFNMSLISTFLLLLYIYAN